MDTRTAAAWRRHWLTQPLQGALLYAFYGLFGLLPVDWASGLGGALARTIGPRLGISRRAERNLERVLPELDAAARRAVIREMWDNLGRVAAEYPHLLRILDDPARLELVDIHHVNAQRGCGRPLIFFGGHLGNWELAGATAVRQDFPISGIYRTPNNRFADRLVRHIRGTICGMGLIRKGAAGAKEAIKLVAGGGNLALLVDQKMNDGIAVPFFGLPAMTAPALAQLALRYDAVVLPVRILRLRGARFRVICEPPLEVVRTGDRNADTLAIMTRVNQILERWIRQTPGQWLWLHRRWEA